jgi:branched-chain amino acid transport system substrate-binding protein
VTKRLLAAQRGQCARLRDDAGVADNARRIVQEMIVNDKVNILAGGITPTVLGYGQLATQAKIATVVMISGASVTTTVSPYYVRTSFILSQSSWIMGEWAAKNGSKRVVTSGATTGCTLFMKRSKRPAAKLMGTL